MTETASETTANVPESTEVKQQTFKDQLQELQFNSLEQLIRERNDKVGRANAANGDVATLTEQIRENSTDPEIVQAREQLSKWVQKLDDLVKPKVEEALANRGEDTGKLEEEIKHTDAALKPGLKYYKEMYGEDAAEFFSKMARLQGVQVRSTGGGRRIRGYVITVTIDGEDKTFENFSSAAKYIGVDTVDVQQAFFNKAGTEDAAKLPSVVSFVINYTETDADGNKTEKDASVKAEKAEAVEASVTAGDDSTDEGSEDESDNGESEVDLESAL